MKDTIENHLKVAEYMVSYCRTQEAEQRAMLASGEYTDEHVRGLVYGNERYWAASAEGYEHEAGTLRLLLGKAG